MKVRVRIGELVLDGLPAAEAPAFRRAIERELAGRLGEAGATGLRPGRVGNVEARSGLAPASVGHAVANAVAGRAKP